MYLNPDRQEFDLATLLSTVPRWGGRTLVPFTVLQHVIVCGRLAADTGRAPIEQLACWLHDAEEGIIGADLARSHKTSAQSEYEELIRKAVYREMKLPYPDAEMSAFVKHIDDFEALAESEILLRPLARIQVHEAHEGDTPDMDDVLRAAEVVWEVARLTRNECVANFVSEVSVLRETRSVKTLSQRL